MKRRDLTRLEAVVFRRPKRDLLCGVVWIWSERQAQSRMF